ncbi:hypothetical protein L6164_029283 [Bauhinia variegata]|uniref:Uncharacterized protein n=1 Tax=Bauhinia variegata TaxID=167791 RepID=A0ACB9L8R9_BAUVA|nr:hypothetical protein L6164_029283 [Bauhinia variegata]
MSTWCNKMVNEEDDETTDSDSESVNQDCETTDGDSDSATEENTIRAQRKRQIERKIIWGMIAVLSFVYA